MDYFHQLGLKIEVFRNDTPVESIQWSQYSKVVLSPGPSYPENANFLMDYIERIDQQSLPCLGVCLGHQAINNYFGGDLKKANRPMHGKVSMIYHYTDLIFSEVPNPTQIVRYHSLVINNLGKGLVDISHTSENEIMAIKHETKPFYGLQFHPESILSDYGLKMLSNWVKISS